MTEPSPRTPLWLCAAAMLLSGCAPLIDIDEITLATKLCAPHGGLEFIYTANPKAKCKDGVKVEYKGVKL